MPLTPEQSAARWWPSLLTRRAWVAQPRSGFIVPTATAGGDAVPIHDTARVQDIDWKFSPTSPPPRTFDRRHRETVDLDELELAERATIVDLSEPARPFVELTSAAHRKWIPWSVVLAIGAYGAVRLAVFAAGIADSPVATAATVSVLGCGVLLVLAQLMDGRTR